MLKTNKKHKPKRPLRMKKTKKTKGDKRKRSNKNRSMVGLAPPMRRRTRNSVNVEEEAIRNLVNTMKQRYTGSLTDESFREIAIFVRGNSEFLFSQMQSGNPQITIMDIIEGTIDYKNDNMREGMNELDVVRDGLVYAAEVIQMIKNQQNQQNQPE